jgi:protein-L-isoaspartate(D-aspartate) O-methyltransferase
MQDDFLHKGRRKKMVEQLRAKFPFDEKVLEAMNTVPRHLFIDRTADHFAYLDKPLSIGAHQTISQPGTVAMQTHLLQLQKWNKVLEIGTGCGYQTAVLVTLGAQVHTIERQKLLYVQAQKTLFDLGLQAIFYYGDGYEGKPLLAPFDRIIVTCGAPEIPPKLLAQLAIGGRMVAPIGEQSQIMTVVERLSETDYKVTTHGNYNFVPMLEGKAGHTN